MVRPAEGNLLLAPVQAARTATIIKAHTLVTSFIELLLLDSKKLRRGVAHHFVLLSNGWLPKPLLFIFLKACL